MRYLKYAWKTSGPPQDGLMTPDQIDGKLHEIVSMVEFLHRAMEEKHIDDETKAFSFTYDDMNLIDFAICDIDRRMKELRNSIHEPTGRRAPPICATTTKPAGLIPPAGFSRECSLVNRQPRQHLANWPHWLLIDTCDQPGGRFPGFSFSDGSGPAYLA
jgi:hypothetical protein